nr:stage IV sporulation protein A [Clostridia bacterium]
MSTDTIYSDIAKRTGGDIYIGVVGPVRTGKSTFIHRFIDEVVLPNIENEYDRDRALDQIPQSADGRTVMTTEPKFVPDGAVRIKMGEQTELNVKLIDCVRYMVDGALGAEENGEARMIMTPWSDVAMPFKEAAELGTGKVIGEHSTIGMLVTTDGTITDIPRESYIEAEERVAGELKSLGKPFAIVLNSAHPDSESARALAVELEEKYGVPVALVSCPDLTSEDIQEILALVLGEFPVRRLTFRMPDWCVALPDSHPIRREIFEKIDGFSDRVTKLGDIGAALSDFECLEVSKIDAGDGSGELFIPLGDELFYKTLSEMAGIELKNQRQLFSLVSELAEEKREHDKVKLALRDAEELGYGIVMPTVRDMTLEEPRTVKEGAGYGVRVTACAECLHIIKTGIRAEVRPVVSSKEQADEVVKYLSDEYEAAPEKIWEANLLGKSLYELVSDGMSVKLGHLEGEARKKLGDTLERIINEGASGLICILL